MPLTALREVGKSAVAGAFYYSGLLGQLDRLRASAYPGLVQVFGYHRVVGDFRRAAASSIPALCVSQTTFRRQMEMLRARFEPVSLETAIDILNGRRHSRRTAVTITFDDGYRDVHRWALPVLKDLGMPATVFVPTGYVGSSIPLPHDRLYELLRRPGAVAAVRSLSRGTVGGASSAVLSRLANELAAEGAATVTDCALHLLTATVLRELIEALESHLGAVTLADDGAAVMSWRELRELAVAGFEIGSHTVGHVIVTHVSEAAARRELADSKEEIESNIRAPARYFAYPNGCYSAALMATVARLGYSGAVTTEDVMNRRGANIFTIGRKVLWEGHSQGPLGRYSPSLTAGHFSDLFGVLRARRVVRGEVAIPDSEPLRTNEGHP
jgi:peptidoglycan/xylan/chitin deacetylase (PgdA/CDA1 family)